MSYWHLLIFLKLRYVAEGIASLFVKLESSEKEGRFCAEDIDWCSIIMDKESWF